MSTLVCLAIASLNDYIENHQPDTPATIEIKTEMRLQIERDTWDEMEWEDILKNRFMSTLIYIALERWESIKFAGTGLSISR